MNKQFYLLIPILLLMVANQVHAQAQTTNIATYGDFDAKYTTDFIQMTFCETVPINLTVDETENSGAAFLSFKWVLLESDGSEPNSPIQIGNGDAGRNLNYESLRAGYHIFRVYGYSVQDQMGCYEMTDIAVYVLPNIPLTPQEITEQYCESDLPPIVADGAVNSLQLGAIVLDATIDQSAFPDTYALNYQWSKSIGGGASTPIGGATSATYIVGSATEDDHATVGTHTYTVKISYAVNDNGCPAEEIMAVITVTAKPDKPVINVGGGHGRPTNP